MNCKNLHVPNRLTSPPISFTFQKTAHRSRPVSCCHPLPGRQALVAHTPLLHALKARNASSTKVFPPQKPPISTVDRKNPTKPLLLADLLCRTAVLSCFRQALTSARLRRRGGRLADAPGPICPGLGAPQGWPLAARAARLAGSGRLDCRGDGGSAAWGPPGPRRGPR